MDGSQIGRLENGRLPESLLDLNLTDTDLSELDWLPSKLESFSLSDSSLEAISLPPSLVSLRLTNVSINNPRSSAFPLTFPRGLQSFELDFGTDSREGAQEQVSLEDLPAMLERLSVDYSDYPDISRLRYLKFLKITRYDLNFPTAAKNLLELQVNNPSDPTMLIKQFKMLRRQFGKLPALRAFAILNGGKIDFANLPKRLISLNVAGCKNTDLRNVPSDLIDLNISWCDIQNLRGLPPHLQTLDISNATKLKTLNDLRSEHLTTLVARWTALEEISTLPKSLKVLDLTGSAIKSMTAFLPNLEALSVSQTALQTLPNLPDTVAYLDISNSNIKAIGALPKNLVTLRVGPSQLVSLQGLPPSVRVLEFCDQK